MRSEKIHYFRTILRKKCFSINLNIGAGPPIQQHVSDKCNVSIFADERSDPLIRSNQIHHIHLIPPQICPFLTGGAEDCDRTNSNFSPAGGFVGGGICFGWVSCHPRRPFNNAHWPACPTLEIHDGHKYKYTKMSFWFSKHGRHSTIWGWSGLPTLQLCSVYEPKKLWRSWYWRRSRNCGPGLGHKRLLARLCSRILPEQD